MDAGSQVGEVIPAPLGDVRAALWHGTAASYIDLHPSIAVRSNATAVAGEWQGGWIVRRSGGGYRATLWHGSASSMIDLNPAGIQESQIFDMSGDQQVGWVYKNFGSCAAMWSGSAASWVDMGPPGQGFSQIRATCGSAQAGYVNNVAAVWFGTPTSYQNLQPYLPPGYGQSIATSISLVNGTYYIGGYANNNATHLDEPFVWIGVPAPGTTAAFAAAAALSARRARR